MLVCPRPVFYMFLTTSTFKQCIKNLHQESVGIYSKAPLLQMLGYAISLSKRKLNEYLQFF